MSIVVVREKEKFGLGQLSVPYLVVENDTAEALSRSEAVTAAGTVALSEQGVAANDYDAQRVSSRCIRITMSYKFAEAKVLPRRTPPAAGTVDYRFNYAAQAKYMTHALALVGIYDDAGEVTDFAADGELLINVQNIGGVNYLQGLEVAPAPEVHMLDYTAADVEVTSSYRNVISGLCGCWNDAEWRGYAAGTIQLVRCVGGLRTDDDWSLGFGLAEVPVREDVDVGGIIVPAVRGCDVLWTFDHDHVNEDLNLTCRLPKLAFVQQVWPLADFDLLDLP